MGTYFSKLSEKTSEITGHYAAFIIAFLFIIIWAVIPIFRYLAVGC